MVFKERKLKQHTEAGPDPEEVELKLLISPQDVDQVYQHPLLARYASGQPRTQQITSTYYDTPDFQIRRHGASLRLRHLDNNCVQTLKADGVVDAGLHRRAEWEAPVPGEAIDLPALRGMVGKHTQWSKMLRLPALDQQLRPLFETRVRRTTWQLRLPDGDEIEVALDQGAIERQPPGRPPAGAVSYPPASEPISEVELELKAGEPAHLYDFALQLSETVALRIGEASKSERGYALCAPLPPAHEVVKASRLDLSRDMTVEQGFQAIATACLAQMQGNAVGVAQGDDPESVHQMRVGLRRLRSALNLFKELLQLPPSLQREVDWLASVLGAARDWEVLSHATLARVGQVAPIDTGVAALQDSVAGVARDKRGQAAEAVQSPRYAMLMLAFSSWLHGAGWRAHSIELQRRALDERLPEFADRTLKRGRRRLLRRGRHLAGGDPQLRHRTRIAAKKMRYAAEFFQALYPARRLGAYVRSLASLQDALGGLNDAAVADTLLRGMEQQELASGIAYARGYLAARQHEEDSLPALWQQVAARKPPSRR